MISRILILVACIVAHSETVEFRGKSDDGPPPLPYDPQEFCSPQVASAARHGLPKCFDCQNIAVIGAGMCSRLVLRKLRFSSRSSNRRRLCFAFYSWKPYAQTILFVFMRSFLGLSGLINAIELSTAGHRVTVYEASDRLGGRILTHRIPDKGYITELGAMRLPLKQHPLTNIYVTERFKLKVTPFVGYDSNALFYINGYRRTFNERILPEDTGFKVYEREKNQVSSFY